VDEIEEISKRVNFECWK